MRLSVMLAGVATLAMSMAAMADSKPLVIYVSPNPIGVDDFLKLGKAGTEKVAAQLGAVAKVYESTDPTTQRQNLEAAAKEGAKVVVAIGFEFNDMLPDVAAAYPKVKFLAVELLPEDAAPQHLLFGLSRIRAELPGRRRGGANLQNRQGRGDRRPRYPVHPSLHRRLRRRREACETEHRRRAEPVGRRLESVFRSSSRTRARRRDGLGQCRPGDGGGRGFERRHLQGDG